ncbi:MAG: hypothetical protein JOZ99_04370 [Actinobacteria bacterium]|nr:hypothetical protein [Actinomycetota bacterium]
MPPLVLLLVFRAAGSAPGTAVVAALWGAVVDLFLFGYAAASRGRLPVAERVAYALVTALFGIAIVVLKAVLH